MNLMDSAKEKIYPGAKITVLDSVTELLSIKADTNMSQHTYDRIMSWGQRMLPEENNMVHNFYETKKLVGLLEPSGKVLLDANIDAEGKWEISISRSGQFVHGACRDPTRWFGEIFNDYTFEEFYPTPKTISKDVYGIWYSQFRHKYSCPGFSEIQIEKAFKKLVAKQYIGKVWDMKQKWLKDGLPSANCTASVWEQGEAYWTSEKFQRNSEIAKTNKNSKEGQRSVEECTERGTKASGARARRFISPIGKQV